ncbi:MAG: 50S ribosomal protein L4 [Lentisphaerae bacterium GWF2_52_8]|nr:MAG: 50S ribosomal protein L4 [Lentisphaerae bacterium GWF2_52_8]
MSKKLNILNNKGAAAGEFTVEDAFIELEKGTQAVHDTVIAIMAGERAGTASTKTRAEVRGGGRKPFRQKGMGRARAGSIRSPIWRGGGITFGPQPRGFDKKINKKVRKLALKRAFSERLEEGSVTLLDELKLADHKTKGITSLIKSLKIGPGVLLVVKDYDENLLRATGNIADLMLIKADCVNVYQLLRFPNIVITKEALDELLQRIA